MTGEGVDSSLGIKKGCQKVPLVARMGHPSTFPPQDGTQRPMGEEERLIARRKATFQHHSRAWVLS